MVNQPTQPQLLLGRYRAIEERDRGGFGAVLVCWDVRLQRRVAIKCLPLDVDEGATAAIHEALAEARASSNLTHPNIVTIHDFEVDEQFAYLVMEYVDGLTLAELIARVEGGVLVYDEVANVLDSVASALAYAHENGVLHLDIKPGNVMIDRSGAVKLGDFGMATLMSAAGWGGARGGTVGYMPPEQLTGELVDERTDVFALATVCYEALTGVSPFAASTAAQSLKLIEKGPAPLSEAAIAPSKSATAAASARCSCAGTCACSGAWPSSACRSTWTRARRPPSTRPSPRPAPAPTSRTPTSSRSTTSRWTSSSPTS